MKTRVEIRIGDGKVRPMVKRDRGGDWYVETTVEQHVAHGRGLWVRTWKPDTKEKAGGVVDGKGMLIGPTRRLTVG